jgi:hypothetical protein
MSARVAAASGLLLAILTLSSCLMSAPLPKGSCTTSTNGKSFARDERQPDQYSLKVYVGGPPGNCREDALTVLHQEAPKFMVQERYQTYELVSDRFNLVPSYFEFIVHFSRSEQ